jgi:hypothetical protein
MEEALGRLAGAVAEGGNVPALMAEIRAREQRRRDLAGRLQALAREPRLSDFDARGLEQAARERLTDWQGLLARQADGAREILRQVLVGRLVFGPDPVRRLYEFTGRWSISQALAGIVPTKREW